MADSTSVGEGGGSCRCQKEIDPSDPPLATGLSGGGGGGGSLAMGQIREYEGPQSVFGPDAKYDN